MARLVSQKFITIDGHKIWCKQWGNHGEPVVLLHGGLSNTENWEKEILPAIEKTHQPFAYDRTAHGRTKIRDGFMHFDFQVEEFIAYVEKVIKKPVHVIGWSDGGNIGLLAAIKRPDLIKSLVGIGMNYTYKGGISFDLNDVSVSDEEKISFAKMSKQDPELLITIIRKAFKVWSSEPKLKIKDLAKVKCPVLVLAADDEPFTSELTFKMYEGIPNARLAVIPGTSHALVKEKPKLMHAIIKDFYKSLDFPITKMPNRRKKRQAELLGNS
jgi:pimeloyl-ACP methyl ester carboxylesterase